MAFKYPKNPVAYLKTMLEPGSDEFFTRRGIGCLNKCSFCPAVPPSHLIYPSQRWRWLYSHAVKRHRGKEKPIKIGAQHGVERSREAMRPSVH